MLPDEYLVDEPAIQNNLLFYFVPFVFFVDELPFSATVSL